MINILFFKKQKNQQGNSLVEMLVVLVILSVVLIVGGWAYLRSIDKNALQNAENLVINHIQEAQNWSIQVKEGSKYGVSLYENKVEIFADETENIVFTYQIPKRVKITKISLPDDRNHLTFEKLTGTPNVEGNLVLQSNYYEQKIIIKESGTILESSLVPK